MKQLFIIFHRNFHLSQTPKSWKTWKTDPGDEIDYRLDRVTNKYINTHESYDTYYITYIW